MKTKKIFTVLSLTAAMLLSSCGSMSNEATLNYNQQQTDVVLSQNNYKVIGQVSGKFSQTYVFGIGGFNKLKESAISEMYKNADLSGSRAIVNVHVQYKLNYYLIAATKTAIATGTLIEFTR